MKTGVTVPDNKPDITIRENEQETCLLTDITISGHINVIKKEAEDIFKYKDPTTEIQCMWNEKTNSDTSNNRDNWNNLKIIQKIPEQLIGKARYQETTENRHTGHYAHTSEKCKYKTLSG